jgi:hypothetical protein
LAHPGRHHALRHLTRDTLALVGQAGFVVGHYEQRYAAGPKPWSYFTMGVAVNGE